MKDTNEQGIISYEDLKDGLEGRFACLYEDDKDNGRYANLYDCLLETLADEIIESADEHEQLEQKASNWVETFHFGLPNHERYFPTFFPTLSGDSASVWEMIDNGAHWREVIVAALLRVGYSGKTAWTITENDKYAFQFYVDVIHCRERIYDYQRQRISYVSMLGTVVRFVLRISAVRGREASFPERF